jgi:hypothetical protein
MKTIIIALLFAASICSISARDHSRCIIHNGFIYSTETPAACGHYTKGYKANDVELVGCLNPYLFVGKNTLVIPSSFVYDGQEYKVKEIQEKALTDVNNVETIIVGEGIVRIRDYAFSDCSSLKTIILPASLEYINENIFVGCNSLRNVILDPRCEDYSNYGSCLIYKHLSFDQNREDSISYQLVAACPATKIPSKVNDICENAFFNMKGIRQVELPRNLKTIRWAAFAGCSNLTQIALPDSLQRIYGVAFGECNSLTSVYIPKNVRYIDPTAFEHCKNLSSIVVDPENPYYDSRSNCNGIVRKKDDALVVSCPTTVVTEDIKGFEWGCFEGREFHSIHIPKHIEDFSAASFLHCKDVESITVDPDNPYYMSPQGSNVVLTKDGKTLVMACRNSRIPEGIEEIDRYAFTCGYPGKVVELPYGVRKIGEKAFEDCSDIIDVVLPASVTEIEPYAFRNCRNLQTVQILGPLKEIIYCVFDGCSKLQSVNIPKECDYVSFDAFKNCISLKDVQIHSLATRISPSAFSGCSDELQKQIYK